MITVESAKPRIGRRNRVRLVVAAMAVVAWFLFEVSGTFASATERYIDRIANAGGCSTLASIEHEALSDGDISDDWDQVAAAADARHNELGCLGHEL